MGYTPRDAASLKSLDSIDQWFLTQRNQSRLDSHLAYLNRGGPIGRIRTDERQRKYYVALESFWYHTALGQDQLRQRVAFALSQILVVSADDPTIAFYAEGLASYMDTLSDHALGNYRDLLIAVSKSPAMGHYLTHLKNEKADRQTGRQPDENYARELMQLFTIGLWELNQDGTRKIDSDGNHIPTYGPDEISGMARVFTGWYYGGRPNTRAVWRGDRSAMKMDRRLDIPMISYPEMHENGTKRIVGGEEIKKNTSADESLEAAIDVLMEHPNTAPFVSHQLIQRLVTSNPSPSYVERVARVFNNNGNGEKGDLFSVTKAILLDPEANATRGASNSFGRLREPILRMSLWLRNLEGKDQIRKRDLSRNLFQIAKGFGQIPYTAPSVFNWYEPTYGPQGPVKDAGIVAPEFKMHNETLMARYSIYLPAIIQRGFDPFVREAPNQPYRTLMPLAKEPIDLVSALDDMFCAGRLGSEARLLIEQSVSRITESAPDERVWTAVMMAMLSPAFMIDL